jgi:diacylglycerol kinase
MTSKRFNFFSRIKSLKFAFEGIGAMIKNEHNSRIHLFAAAVVIILGFLLHLNTTEWSLIVILICLVFIAELINSALERITDLIYPEIDERIKIIKDYSAAIVLISAIISLIVGGLIFVPKFLGLFKK